MNTPLISVIVPCYNQAVYLREAVESVVKQTYHDWECIIINDGSTDNSEAIAMDLVAKDKRIHYYKKENGGLAAARNTGIEIAAGTYILPLDGDDRIHPQYMEKALPLLQDETLKVIYSQGEYFGAKTGIIDLPEYSIEELARMNMIFCTAFFRKLDWQKAGGYNPNMIFGWEDWNLWISILEQGGRVYKIPDVLFYYRIKSASMLANLEGRRKQSMFMQLYLNHRDFFDGIYSDPLEVFDKYRDLRDYSSTIEEAYNLLKGLLSLKPAAYSKMIKKILSPVANEKLTYKKLPSIH